MQKNQFTFNIQTHDFWPVYHAIHECYPIGIQRGEDLTYFNYPGIQALDRRVVETIHHENDFYKSWLEFENRLAEHYNLEVRGTTYGQAPSVSADLMIEKIELEGFSKVKKISIAISLVGQFFTIYGIDESTVVEPVLDSYDRNYHSINAVTASPHQEFRQYFEQLKSMIEERYEGYRFIPFFVNDFIIKGLQVRYLDHEECTVFQALFNQSLDNAPSGTIRGDRYYGHEEWKVEGGESKFFFVK
ncbi:hypothetical protein PBAL39_00542 [Pedobacter sp. BAL39]|uniref:hypothetical protein n=1 Tax=Pedobacter sp. BAL39 TaxID=391596 RepID=UPI0001559B78|nr:hypothetical protein [Pedobacter sp. BAL39]EDM38057.1 hypothetical protein PBAL39_00542 [Pedobacter sp. BAL39]